MDQMREQLIMRKVSWRLIPVLLAAYILCYLDRVNLSYAALQMNQELALTATAFGWGAGIFFLGYFLFEVPSNLMLQKYGARFWIARIMVSWGLLSAMMAFVGGSTGFIAVRFLLGAAEAGFFPGVIFYLTYWFPERYRAIITSRFMFGVPGALLIGSPISSWILSMDGIAGVAGWRWLFILEGVPTVLMGFFIYYYLTDIPAHAHWLDAEERNWLQGEIDRERAQVEAKKKLSLTEALLNPHVLALGFVYFTVQVGIYGVNMWLPQIMKTFSFLSTLQIGFIAAIPFAAAAIGMLLIGKSSDRRQERKWHLLFTLVLGAVGLIGSAYFGANAVFTIVLLSVSSIGLYASMPIFWTIPPTFLTGAAAAGGIALINSLGNIGGFAGPFTIGLIKDATGNFMYGLIALGVWVVIGCICAYIICHGMQQPKAAKEAPVATASGGRA